MNKNMFKIGCVALLVILVFTVVILLNTNSIGSKSNNNDSNREVVDKNLEYSSNQSHCNIYYSTIPRYGLDGAPDFSDMFNTENSLTRLKNFNDDIHNNFNYFEIHTQPLYFEGQYNGDKKFSEDYEEGIDRTNAEGINFVGDTIITTPLKTLMIGKSWYSHFDDYIEEGRNFNDSDFTIKNQGEKVNIILGIEYKGAYKIGDVLTLSLHQKEMTFNVIGFFKEHTSINYQNANLIFDKRIIMPFYDITYEPKNESDDIYQKIYYSQKNEGLIKINETAEDIIQANYLNKVEELADKYDLLYSISQSYRYIDLYPQYITSVDSTN